MTTTISLLFMSIAVSVATSMSLGPSVQYTSCTFSNNSLYACYNDTLPSEHCLVSNQLCDLRVEYMYDLQTDTCNGTRWIWGCAPEEPEPTPEPNTTEPEPNTTETVGPTTPEQIAAARSSCHPPSTLYLVVMVTSLIFNLIFMIGFVFYSVNSRSSRQVSPLSVQHS
jgi:hypothetical protein